MLPEPSPPQTYVDAAFILDSSWKMSSDEFETVKVFLSKALDAFDISSYPVISATGDRVAMVSHATPGFKPRTHKSPVKMEFDLVTHSSKLLMQNHIKNSLQQLNGEAALGYTIEWVMENIFSEAPNPRDNKFIIVISAGETSSWDKEMLKEALMTAKCQGYALFVISLRPLCNDEELEELASIPLEQHLVQLGRIHKPDLGYIERFMKAFVRLLRSKLLLYSSILGYLIKFPYLSILRLLYFQHWSHLVFVTGFMHMQICLVGSILASLILFHIDCLTSFRQQLLLVTSGLC